jgi:hypothetical protein
VSAAGGTTATSAIISFSPPTSDGGALITSYTVTSAPGGVTAVGSSSPITISGLTTGTTYTFTVTATNSAGTGPASSATNSIVASAPFVPGTIFGVNNAFGATHNVFSYPSTGGTPTTINSIITNETFTDLFYNSSTGRIYGFIASNISTNSRVLTYTASGTATTFIQSPFGAAGNSLVRGGAFDNIGNIWISLEGTGNLRYAAKYSSGGALLAVYNLPNTSALYYGFLFDSSNNVYAIPGSGTIAVAKISSTGVVTGAWSSSTIFSAQFGPPGITTSTDMYLFSSTTSTIQKYDFATGTQTTYLSGISNAAGIYQFGSNWLVPTYNNTVGLITNPLTTPSYNANWATVGYGQFTAWVKPDGSVAYLPEASTTGTRVASVTSAGVVNASWSTTTPANPTLGIVVP